MASIATPGTAAARECPYDATSSSITRLVMIIAIGESVVSVAVAVSHTTIDWSLLAGALLGIALAMAL